MGLPVNFVDAILDPTMDGKRRVKLTEVSSGVYKVEDVTVYSQVGSNFGALQVNNISQAVNNVALMENITLYVSKAGSDVTGDGTSGKPFATITMALAMIPKNLNGYDATVNIAGGTYAESVLFFGFHGGSLNIVLGDNITVGRIEEQETTCVNISNAAMYTITTTTTTQHPISVARGCLFRLYNTNLMLPTGSSYSGIYTSIGSNFDLMNGTATITGAGSAIRCSDNSKFFANVITGSGNIIGILGEHGSEISYGINTLSATTPESLSGGAKILNKVIDESRLTSNNTVTEANKFGVCATELNPAKANSLAQKNAQLFGIDVTILTTDWVTDNTDSRYTHSCTKTFATMGSSISFGLVATVTSGIKTALEKTENSYVQEYVAEDVGKTIKFYATAKPTGSLKYRVRGVTL